MIIDLEVAAVKINSLSSNIAKDRLKVAKLLEKLMSEVEWELTAYNSFTDYVNNRLNMPYSTAFNYVTGQRAANKWGYSTKELNVLSDTFAFNTTMRIFNKLTKKETIGYILEKFSEPCITKKTTTLRKIINYNTFNFELDDEHAETFLSMLSEHGLLIKMPSKRRLNLGAAVTNFIDAFID